MNRTYFALFVALLIHIIILLLFFFIQDNLKIIPKKEIPQEKRLKISLKEMPKIDKKSALQKKPKKIKPTLIAPPMPKGSQLKKIIKPKPKPKVIKEIKSIQAEKIKIPLKKKVPQKIIDPMAWMYEDQSTQVVKIKEKKDYSHSNINQNIKELYGEEFGKLTQGQQKYIIDNQEIMRRITQQVLTRVASVNIKNNLNVNRTNIIEFYLHENGDMTDFKFLQKSGYFTLDETTRETIEYSYSRYPRPKEKILIRYNVYYNLAGY